MKLPVFVLALSITASMAYAHSIVGTQYISCAGSGDSAGMIHVDAQWDENALGEKIAVQLEMRIRGEKELHEATYKTLRGKDGQVVGRLMTVQAGTLEIRDFEDSDYANPNFRDNGTFHGSNGSSYSLGCAAAYSSNGEE